MAINPYDPRVKALLGQWYDIVGPQVGQWGPYQGAGYYGRQIARPYYVYVGADPATGAPVVAPVPAGTPGATPMPPPGAVVAPSPGAVAPPMVAPPPPPMMPSPMPMGPPPMGPPPMEAFPFPARGAVVEMPMPTQANRDILPMSTGVPILPTQSAQITGRPQTLVFKIGRFVISNAGTAGGAADWIVNDIKIGNRSQFVQSGDVPGDLFATNAIDTFVRFEAAQTAMDVVVVVTYIGLNESGAPFFGAMVGTAAV